jgi:hypothetical protein
LRRRRVTLPDVFRPTDGACADCGGDAFAETDALGDAPLAVCFGCYVDRTDRVGACCPVGVRADETAGEFVVAAPSVEGAGELAASVADELSGSGVRVSVGDALSLAKARGRVGDYHARELARAKRSESRHVYAATSRRGTVVDTETRTDRDTRAAVADRLARRVVESGVRRRKDVADSVAAAYPRLAEHRATRALGLKERVWRTAKERGVSDASERAARNQTVGRDFEEFFAEWCDERCLPARRGKEALVRLYPEVADEVSRKTDGLAGVPDFLVRGDGQRSFGDEWRPDGDTFVEVKRGASRLSREQERAVAHLKSHGFDVYVLRGEPDRYSFDRR